jgi:quinoprotein glucose dehydrogenase
VTKRGFAFVRPLDRQAVWPIEERPIPQSTVPGDAVADAAVPDEAARLHVAGQRRRNLIDFTPGAPKTGADQLKQ